MEKRSVFRLCALGVVLVAAVVLALSGGYAGLSALADAFTGESGGARFILLEIRLPRVLLAALCGMGLALSGCVLQAVSDNQLADPGILGINSGAGFSVMLFMSLFPALHLDGKLYQPLFAMVGGLVTAYLLYRFAKRGDRIRPAHFLLGGIGLSAGFTALMTIVGADMESSLYQMVSRWLVGNIWGTSWYQIGILLPYLVVLLPLLYSRMHVLDLLLLGDDAAASLGVQVERERKLLLFLAAALAASCVSVSGGISFIGLVAPHIARRLVGARHRLLLGASVLTGGILLVLADLLGRVLLGDVEIPTGIVTSVVAAPYFLYLLHKKI